MNYNSRYINALFLALAVSLAFGTTHCQAQFTDSDWVITTTQVPAGGGATSPATQVTDITANGFRYIADPNDKHNIAQKLSAPVELLQPGDKVTLQFDVVYNQTPDPSGGSGNNHGGNNFRYALFDTTQNSDFVNSALFAGNNTGGGGGEGFAVINRNKLNGTGATDNGKEQTSAITTQINESLGFLGPDPGNPANTRRWDGRVLRGNTGGDINEPAHWMGNDLADLHRLEINVTMVGNGLFFIENSHTNVTQGTSTGDLDSDRLFHGLWRDPTDNTLSFDGMALTVDDTGAAGTQIDFTVSNLSLTKTSIGTPGVDSDGKFHVDFVGRADQNHNTCGACWLGAGDDFSWAPFILEGDLNEPFGGFTNPTLAYDDVFGSGSDVTITTDFPKVTQGNFTAPSDAKMAANYMALTTGNAGSVTLSLPAGEYEVTTYHYSNASEVDTTADRVITDANGTSSAVGVTAANENPVDGDFTGNNAVEGNDFLAWQRGESTTALSPADLAEWQANYGEGVELVGVTFTISSDGINDVVITYTNTGDSDFPLNGIVLDSLPGELLASANVPEPTTMALGVLLVLSGVCVRRK